MSVTVAWFNGPYASQNDEQLGHDLRSHQHQDSAEHPGLAMEQEHSNDVVDSNIYQIDAAFDKSAMENREDFNGEIRHRFENKGLEDATLWKTDPHMSHDTTSHLAYAGVEGEAAIATTPPITEAWCPMGAEFDARTVSGETYKGALGAAPFVKAQMPGDSDDLLQGDGIFDGETTNTEDFPYPSEICEEHKAAIGPGESDIWKTDAHMSQKTTSHLAFAGEQCEQPAIQIHPKETEDWCPTGPFDARTVYGDSYNNRAMMQQNPA